METEKPSPEQPLISGEALCGQWHGNWEIFSADGEWAEMKRFSWECWATIDDHNSMLIWDVDVDKDTGLAELELDLNGNSATVSGGRFMDLDSGYEHWRLKLTEDDKGPLLTLRGSYSSVENGDFSFVFYLRPEGDN